VRAESIDKQHQIPLIKGSKNVEFHAFRAIFRVASANSTNKGHRDMCGKAGIRLVAFTDAAGLLHMIGAGAPSYL
jgi:hypothetical protein